MPTMILVEDESFERHSLMNHIDWNLIGVQIIGEAANGERGLALVLELRPDIVLSDVNMPIMNGLEMARKIRAVAPDTKILFLSAYDDFDYAKQAIDLNIQAYVMKPVNESELLRAVKKAVDDITEQALEKRLLSDIKSSYSESLSLARQALVSRTLIGVPVNEKEAQKLKLEWLCHPNGNISLLLSFFDKTSTQVIDESLSELNKECQKLCTQSISICMDAGRMVTLCLPPQENHEIPHQMEQTIRSFFTQKGQSGIRLETLSSQSAQQTPAELYTAFLARHMAGYEETKPINRVHQNKQQIVDEVQHIIEEQYHEQLTLEAIAQMMHFTPNYIGTVFKLVKKTSVNRYLMQVRLEKVCQLLVESDKPVNDVATLCGFGSITYFHTAFKKEYGITPSEYRQQKTSEAEA